MTLLLKSSMIRTDMTRHNIPYSPQKSKSFIDFFVSYSTFKNNKHLTKPFNDRLLKHVAKNKPLCDAGIVDGLRLDKGKPRQANRKKVDPAFKYFRFANQLMQGDPTDEQIKEFLRLLKNNLNICWFERPDGGKSIFTGMQKGTTRYNKKYRYKILDFTKQLCEQGGETFALTITCDPKMYNNNRFFAWKNYSEEIHAVLENLRKNHSLKYLWVKESTSKGFPHAHILLMFPRGTFPGYEKLGKNQVIKYGKLYNYFKKNVVAPVFELHSVKGANLKYYLTKYVSKFETENLFALAEKKEPLTKAERKALMCMLCTIITRSRQFGFCKLPKQQKNATENTSTNDDISTTMQDLCDNLKKAPSAEREGQDFARLRAHLICLCNNSLFDCRKNIYISSYATVKAYCPKENIEEIKDFDKIEAVIKNTGKFYGCRGCIYSRFADWIAGRDNSFIKVFEDLLQNCGVNVKLNPYIAALNDKEWCITVAQMFNAYSFMIYLTFDNELEITAANVFDMALYENTMRNIKVLNDIIETHGGDSPRSRKCYNQDCKTLR